MFDTILEKDILCKVYHDGSHFVAVPSAPSQAKKQVRFASPRDDSDLHFMTAFQKSFHHKVKSSERPEWIRDYLLKEYSDVLAYDDEWIQKKTESELHNLSGRRKRFRRKAYLNPWNYFVTISYDDKKFDSEADFRESCKRTFNNFHTRRNWGYMGVFERGEDNNRLHFHALCFVPDGQMPGKMRMIRRYSEKDRRMKFCYQNSFFKKAYGINSFDPVQQETFKDGKLINYILKYICKDGERIIYARGVPTELVRLVGDASVAAELIDFVQKFVLFDDDQILCSEPEKAALDPLWEKMQI